MSRLRHPISAIREPFGTAGLIVACVALLAALGGTAFAAAKLSSTQKKEVEKIAKKLAGKPGAPGAAGARGESGSAGANGAAGTAGESVTITPIPSGHECGTGVAGTKLSNATGTGKVCNGKNGTTGFTETLPSNKTETGAWAFGPYPPVESPHLVHVAVAPFAIPLATKLGESEVHYLKPGFPTVDRTVCEGLSGSEKEACEEALAELEEACPGNSQEPAAGPANLCIYAAQEEAISTNSSLITPAGAAGGSPPGAGTTGATQAFLLFNGSSFAQGTWAVTGE